MREKGIRERERPSKLERERSKGGNISGGLTPEAHLIFM